MKIDGSCYCGAITYEAKLGTASVGICHCNDCQELSASAFHIIGMVKAGAFRMFKGKPRVYLKIGDSGNLRE